MLTSEERRALCTCSHCGSRDVAVVPVPGGWLELICEECGEIWWYESNKKRVS